MNNEDFTIDVVIKRIPTGVMRKYTKKEMEIILMSQHPKLVSEVLNKSYLVDDELQAAKILVDILIDECLDIDTLESDEARKARQPPPPPPDDLWDRISEIV